MNNFYNKELKSNARELRNKSVSKAEKRIWKLLLSRSQMGVKFKRQRPIDQFVVDIYCAEINLIIEVDGNSHDRKQEYDFYRQSKLEALGFYIIRYEESEILFELEDVQKRLSRTIEILSQ